MEKRAFRRLSLSSVKIEGFNFEVNDTHLDDEEFLGQSSFEVPYKLFKTFREEYLTEESNSYLEEETSFYRDCEYVDKDIITIYNPDFFARFYDYVVDYEGLKNVKVIYNGSFLWLIHDCMHFINDMQGGEIVVTERGEELAIFKSLQTARKLNYYVSTDYIEKLEEAYFERFKKNIDLEKYKSYE